MKEKKSKLERFLVFFCALVLVMSVFAVAAGAFLPDDFEGDIVLIERADTEEIQLMEQMDLKVLDTYGSNVLIEVEEETIPILEQKGLRVNTLPGRTEISVKGHHIDITEGEPELDPDLQIEAYGEGEEGIYIVHMLGPVNPEWRSNLEEAGVEIINYVPNYAYEVVTTPELADEVEDFFFVDWVGIYQPEYKLHSRLDEALDMDMPINVKLRPGFDIDNMALIESDFDVVAAEDLRENGMRLVLDVESESELEDLAMMNDVYFISPYVEPELHAEMDIQLIGGGQWFMDDEYDTRDDLTPPPREGDPQEPYRLHGDYGAYINQLGYSGDGVTITTADTGVGDGTVGDAGVSDFTGRVIGGYGFGADETNWADGHYHGTACTGLIVGDTHDGTGAIWSDFEDGDMDYYMGQGLAYESEIFATKIFDDAGGFMPTEYYPIVEIPAQESDAYIHSNSWGAGTMGSYSDSDEIFDQAVRDADRDTDENRPMVITTSAGNDGGRGGYEQEIGSPANAKNVITIGGNQPYNPGLGYENPENMFDGSSRGWTEDNRIKPDVIAPSESVISQNTPLDEPDTYIAASGTSFGNPLVAGAATIIVEWYEERYDEKPSPAMVKSILVNTANELDPEVGDTRGHVPNQDEGWGVPDISKLVYPLDEPMGFQLEDQEVLIETGDVEEYEISPVNEDEPLKITLSYTDEHAMDGDSTGGTPTLKNNLDLEVEAPSGDIYRGNAFDNSGDGMSDSGFSYPNTDAMTDFDYNGDGWDDVNNLQNVFIHPDDIESGNYIVRVIGTDVPEDANNDGDANQDYALTAYNVPDDIIDIVTPDKEGVIEIEREEYAGNDLVNITLTDIILEGEGTHEINVASMDADGNELENMTVELIEDEDNLGFFFGTVQLTEDENEDEALYVEHDGEIIAWYWDADPGHPDDLENDEETDARTEEESLDKTRENNDRILQDLDNDVGVIEIISPDEMVNTDIQNVEITVYNFGEEDQTDVPVEATIEEMAFYDDVRMDKGYTDDVSEDYGVDWAMRSHGSTIGEYSWDFGDGDYGSDPYMSWLISPEIELTDDDDTDIILTFDHWREFYDWDETIRDGGNLRISTEGDDGPWDLIHPEEGYDGVIYEDNNNPIGGEEGWGYQLREWETATFDLNDYAGETIHLRWTAGIDDFIGNREGWRIDNIQMTGGDVVFEDDTAIDIASGEEITVTLDDWTPGEEGGYFMNATTDLDGDEDPTNDYKQRTILVTDLIDVGVDEIVEPPEMVNSVDAHPIESLVKNYGTLDQTDVPVITTINEDAIALYEDFEEEIPDDWTIDNTTEEPATWHHSIDMAYVDGVAGIDQDEWLISPSLDMTDAAHASLQIDHDFYTSGFSGDSWGRVHVSNDGGDTWELLDEWIPEESASGLYEYDISDYADGEEDVQVAFQWDSTDDPDNGDWDDWEIYEVTIGYMEEVYYDETTVDVDAQQSVLVEFEDWEPDETGTYFMYSTTDLEDDEIPGNDAESQYIIVTDIHDVGVSEILSPVGNVMIDETHDVEAEIENFGTFDEEDVPVYAEMLKILYLIEEDFHHQIPDEWTIESSSDETWKHGWDDWADEGMALVEDDEYLDQEEWLISPVFNASDALETTLYLDQDFNDGFYGEPYGEILISTDSGDTWDEIDNYTDDAGEMEYDISDYADGEEEVQIAFVFETESHESFSASDYWEIYEISVTSVDEEYEDEITIDVDAQRTIEASFESWDPSDVGEYELTITTDLEGDEDPDNDYQIETIYVRAPEANIGVDDIISPEHEVWEETQTVQAEITNYGDFDVMDVPVEATAEYVDGFIEDFSGDFPPEGWETDDWTQSDSNDAGGTPPEAYLHWFDVTDDYSYLKSPAVDTTEVEELTLEFYSYLDHNQDDLTAMVQVRSDPDESWIDVTPWDNPVSSSLPPNHYEIDITDHLGPGTQVIFEYYGSTLELNGWYVNDVILGERHVDYVDEIEVDLDLDETKTVFFEDWTPSQAGDYVFNVTALHPDEDDPESATMEKFVEVVPIIYDLEATSIDEPTEPIFDFETRDVIGTVTNVGNQNITDAPVVMTIEPIIEGTPIDEDFSEDPLEDGWHVEDRDGNDNTWEWNEDEELMEITPIDDHEHDILWTEIADCTEGEHRVLLEFYSYLGGGYDQNERTLLISTDQGASYRRISSNITDGEITFDITQWASEEEDVMIGWEIYSEEVEEDEYWAIDDVKIITEHTEEEYESELIVDELNVSEEIQLQFDEWEPLQYPMDYLITMETQLDLDENLENVETTERVFVEEHFDPEAVDPNPYDGEEDVTHSPVLNVTVNDPNGYDMNVTFYLFDDDDNEIGNKTHEGVPSGEIAWRQFLLIEVDSTFSWYVEVDDGVTTVQSEIWEFHTYEPEGRYVTDSAAINADPPGQVDNLDLDWDADVWDVTGNELNWDASPDDGAGHNDTEYYVIYRAEEDTGPWDETTMIDYVEAEGLESYTYIDEGMADDGEQWHYIVRAVDRVGNMEMNEDAVSELPLPMATDPEPEDGEWLEGLEQDLSAYITNPTDEIIDVEFYDGLTRELIDSYQVTEDGRVETTWELEEENMAQDNYWFVITSYEDYNFGSINPTEYTLTVDISGQGTVEVDPEEESYIEGSEVELEAIPDDQWNFVEWTGDYEGTDEEITITMESDMEITANFEYLGELEGEWRWLYDADHRPDQADNALSSAEPQVWYGGIILDLSDDVGGYISEVAYFDYDETANYVQAHVAEEDNGAPGDWLASSDEHTPTGGETWVELELTEDVAIEDPGEYWIVLEIDDPSEDNLFPFGTINPNVEDGQWSNFGDPHDPADWTDLVDLGIFTAWGLEAYVEVPVSSDHITSDRELMDQDINVAVVDEENWQENEVEYKLEEYLPDGYNVDTLEADELLDEMHDYDTFVIQRFGSDELAEDFLDELEGHQGVVYLDTHQGATAEAYSDGVYRLHNIRNDPEFRDSESLGTESYQTMEILESHPIFDGIGSEGDIVPLFDGTTNWGSWFDDYSGDILAEKDYGAGYGGPAVGVCDDNNEVLLPAKGIGFFGEADDPGWTEEANQMFANAVEFVAGEVEFDPIGWHFHLIDDVEPHAEFHIEEDPDYYQGDAITLNATASYNPPSDNSGIENYTWNIVDPTGEEYIFYGPIVEKTLEYALYYDITLTVYDAYGNYASTWDEVYSIDTEDPIADAGTSDQTRVGEEYILDGSDSTDNVEVVNWTWYIEGVSEEAEGYEETLYGETVGYHFPYVGTYDILLEVSDAEGNSDTDMISIIVNPPAETFEIISPEDGEIFYEDLVIVEWEDYGYMQDMTYEIRLNYGDWDYVGTDTDYTFINLEDGTYVAQVRATDSMGNTYTRTVTFEVDTIDPEVQIITPSNGIEELTFEEEFVIEGMTDPGVQVWINGEEVPVGEDGSFTYDTTLIDGLNIFRVVSEDDQENTDEMTVYALYLPDIQDLWTEVDAIGDDIYDIQTAIAGLEDNIDSLESSLDDLQGQINSIQSDLDAARDDIEGLQTELGIVQDNVDDLELDMDEAQEDIDELENALAEAEGIIATLQSELTDLELDLEDFEQEQEEIDAEQDDDISMAWILGTVALILAILAIIIAIFTAMKKGESEEFDDEETFEEDPFDEEDL